MPYAEQFAGDARSHHFHAAIVDAVAERAADLADRLLLRLVAAWLLGYADQDLFRSAELLPLDFAKPERVQRLAHRGEIRRAGLGAHLQGACRP